MAVSPKEPLRAVRERELIAATRALFDERGMQDAPIEEIARAVGIARGLIYRHFSSKDELFVATVVSYLDELGTELETAIGGTSGPVSKLKSCTAAYAGYCERYPAFLDSSLALMRQPAGDLQGTVSPAIWLRLGQGMARCLDQLASILRAGNESGEFSVEDPDYMSNVLWTQMLGAMNLGRLGVGVRQISPEVPGLFRVDPGRLVATCVAAAMATVGAGAAGDAGSGD